MLLLVSAQQLLNNDERPKKRYSRLSVTKRVGALDKRYAETERARVQTTRTLFIKKSGRATQRRVTSGGKR